MRRPAVIGRAAALCLTLAACVPEAGSVGGALVEATPTTGTAESSGSAALETGLAVSSNSQSDGTDSPTTAPDTGGMWSASSDGGTSSDGVAGPPDDTTDDTTNGGSASEGSNTTGFASGDSGTTLATGDASGSSTSSTG